MRRPRDEDPTSLTIRFASARRRWPVRPRSATDDRITEDHVGKPTPSAVERRVPPDRVSREAPRWLPAPASRRIRIALEFAELR